MGGKTFINDSVFVEIAKEAMRKVEEVYKQERKGGLAGFTRMFVDRFAPQISVKKTDPTEFEESAGNVSFEVKVTIVYGVKIPEVAEKAREKIISEVETLTGYTVEKVDLVIERIIKPEEVQEEKPEEIPEQ
ncbi:MAG TPA: Asp23/Gls24 family envelope stress response protein [Thermoanaerobacterales bacterium]|nr:Asp23/Gls24 family envelope stress response protein [Thermoanaerobacterales bacterium]